MLTTLLATDRVVYVDHHGWWPVFPLLWLLFWAVVITLVVRRRRYWLRHHRSSAEHVVAERYARGEIDEAELQHRMAVLKGLHDQT